MQTKIQARTLCCWLMLGALGASCQRTVEQQLQGHWRGVELETTGEDNSAARQGWARGTSLRFVGSQLNIQVPGQPLEQTTYVIEHHEDGNMTVNLQRQFEAQTTHFTLETASMLRWHINEENTILMQRK